MVSAAVCSAYAVRQRILLKAAIPEQCRGHIHPKEPPLTSWRAQARPDPAIPGSPFLRNAEVGCGLLCKWRPVPVVKSSGLPLLCPHVNEVVNGDGPNPRQGGMGEQDLLSFEDGEKKNRAHLPAHHF